MYAGVAREVHGINRRNFNWGNCGSHNWSAAKVYKTWLFDRLGRCGTEGA
jgi:hypothetical protein